ncbi:MAG: hypothetical protein M3Y72_17535 [Acidobacteriota bacterium]|nr:hypothetical protein [Acidobacteriota bacterium]
MASFEQAFTLQVPTAGNLAGHGLAILLLKLGVPVDLCEKLLITICIAGLAAAFRYAAMGVKSAHPAAGFFVLPFLYNWPLQMGFWSFSLGVPFLLVCVGLCLRYRGRWNGKNTTWLFVTVAAVYACHPIDWAVCGVAVGAMTISAEWKSLLRGSNRRQSIVQTLIPLGVFVPFAIPNLLFAERNQSVQWDRLGSIRGLLWPIYTGTPVHLFEGDTRVAKLLFVFLLLLSLVNLGQQIIKRRVRYEDFVLLVSIALFAMGLASPDRIGEGSYLEVRFLLFGYLTWVLWLGLTLTRGQLMITTPVVIALSLWLMLARIPEWRAFSGDLAKVVRAGGIIEANSTVCQRDFSDGQQSINPMTHAIDLLSGKQIIDVRDYEAGRFAFWTRFRPGYYFDEDYRAPSSLADFEGALERFESRTGRELDYIVLTDMKASPQESLQALLPSLANRYRLVSVSSPAVAVYRIRN